MATKDNCLFFKNKQNLVVNTKLNVKFNNLNLNQNNQSFVETVQPSKNVGTQNKKTSNYDFSHYNDSKTRQNFTSFGKSKLSSSFANPNIQKDYGKKEVKPLNANSSTLSLHITAYENSMLATSDNPIDGAKAEINKKKENISSIKKWKAVKESFNGSSSSVKYAFELPRQQQQNQKNNPEVMQFKASQQLSNVNGASSSSNKMSQNKKFRLYSPRPIIPADEFCPQEILSQHVNFSIPSTIEGSTCEVATMENESLPSAAERVRELFFTRTELICRALSGSYVITREEALDDLREKYDATKDPKLEILLHFPWNKLPVRFRKVVNRTRAKVRSFTQAEIRLENDSGIYFYYFNFIPCDLGYPSFTRYSYVLAIESTEKGGFLQPYFALTCPSNGDTDVPAFTENVVKGICHWIHSQKKANVNVPLSCVPSSYYTILDDVRTHSAVQELSSIWSNYERTDKSKHVFEDVGIVAYLATYWLSNDIKDIHFVDIGCGNGIVSYLLNTIYGKNFKGIGYDVKERKIWEYYKSKGQDVLKVQAIVPNFPLLEQPFPDETNYVIGIHTDELTPWIPLIAMKRKCNFFLLPCCPFDFFGRFVKRNQHKGENEWEYFNYIVSLAQILGFDVKTDGLKIPSEKKNAIIGTIPSSGKLLCDYDPQWEDLVRKIMEPSFKANNSRGFQPRTSEIEVKNCSKLPVEVRNSINQSIVNILQSATDPEVGVALKDIVSKLSDEQKTYLKSQNGGIQTFIKNNRAGYIYNRGNVILRPNYQIPGI